MKKNIDIRIHPVQAGLSKTAKSTDVVVKVSALADKKSKTARRAPSRNLAIVIDASGSMAGKPLADAIAATRSIVSRLDPDSDRVAIVAYGSQARLVRASTPVREALPWLEADLCSISDMGSTSLRAGWLLGAHEVAAHVKEYGVSRVLLLSDGVATDGSTVEQMREESARLGLAGISTSTYGLGQGFNEALMTALRYGGNAFYASDSAVLTEYFSNEFLGLSRLAGQRAQIRLRARRGSGDCSIDVLNDYPQVDGWCQAGNIVAGSDVWLAARVGLDGSDGTGQLDIAADLRFVDLEGNTVQVSCHGVLHCGGGRRVDTWARERVREAEAARLQRLAVACAAANDMAGASRHIHLMQANAGNNAYVGAVSANLGGLLRSGRVGEFVKEATYGACNMSTRSCGVGEMHTSLNADPLGLRKAVQGSGVDTGSTP